MEVGTVEMVSVEWIMDNLFASVDGFGDYGQVDLERLIRTKATDYGFGNLVGTILDKGFRVPIVLDLGWNGEGTVTLGNGHHRLSAAILLVLDEIPVFWAYEDYMSSRHSDTEEVCEYEEWEDLRDFLDQELWS